MAALETLLHRFCTRPSVLDESLTFEAFPKRTGPALENAWYAWAKAQAAMQASQPQLALAWLRAGRDARQESNSAVLNAEALATEARCWIAVDEPREAIGPAHAAWKDWLSLARDPRPDVIVPPARALLAVLSEPHPPPRLSDEEVLRSWLFDRFPRGFQDAGRQLMSVFADLNQLEAADEVARDFLAWVDRNVGESAGARFSGLLTAGFLIAVGDVYDRCGDNERALATFEDGLVRIEGLPEIDEIVWTRAQLRFNLANQLAQLGRLEQALEAFQVSHEDVCRAGPPEAILRSRYSLCFTKYKLGRGEGLVEQLIDLASEYEKALQGARSGSEQLAARQSLDRVYRLWLRLSASRLDTVDARDTLLFLHQLFALKEEEGKLIEVWNETRRRPDANVLSEITVMLDRVDQRPGTGIFVVEQVVDAFLFVSFRAGRGPWNSRIHFQLLDGEGMDAIKNLILEHRAVTDHLGTAAVPIMSAPSEGFASACSRAWSVLSDEIRRDIGSTETLLVSIDNQTELDQLPVELFHDGTTHLGLRADVLRAPALRDLNVLLGDNRTNAKGTGSVLVVRAEDDLSEADDEAQAVEQSVKRLGLTPFVRSAPRESELLDDLGSGVDLFHYVGHGLADFVGEELPLGHSRSLTARDLERLHPAPAPVTVLSACLAGRGRQLRTGELQGFGTQLLRRGAPAVVAAKYFVPDLIATEYAKRLYSFLEKETIEVAVRATRSSLAGDGYHPAVWSGFVVFGRPRVKVEAPHANEVSSWPAAVLRYLATGAEDHLIHARDLLEQDRRLPAKIRSAVRKDLDKLAGQDPEHFDTGILSEKRGLEAFPEAMIASHLIRLFGVLRHTPMMDHAERERLTHGLISQALLVQRVLGDTYLLVAIAVEMSKRTLLHYQKSGGNVSLRASRRLRWLSAEGDNLAEARSILNPEEE